MTPEGDDPMHTPQGRRAWAKLNAYGFVLAFLALMSLADLLHPAGTQLAQAVGGIPPGQPFWTVGFGASGLLLLLGFLRTDRLSETLGLILLTLGVIAQTTVAYALLGWGEFTLIRLALVGVVAGCTWARVSVLWARDGLVVTIPARGVQRPRRRR